MGADRGVRISHFIQKMVSRKHFSILFIIKIMKIVTKENLDSFKSSDLVCLECYNCGKEFEKQKKYILDEIKFKRGNNKYCSWKCFNESKNNCWYW